jgi:hypothetical protein
MTFWQVALDAAPVVLMALAIVFIPVAGDMP